MQNARDQYNGGFKISYQIFRSHCSDPILTWLLKVGIISRRILSLQQMISCSGEYFLTYLICVCSGKIVKVFNIA